MNLTDVLLSGYEAANAPERGRVQAPTVLRLDSVLGSFQQATMDLHGLIIGEYLFSMHGLAAVEQAPAAAVPDARRLGPLARVLYDRSDTVRLLNDEYTRLGQYASAPHGPPPDPPMKRAAGAGWWLRNPVGKQALDTLSLPIGNVIQTAATDWAACLQKRDAVRPRITAVLGRD